MSRKAALSRQPTGVLVASESDSAGSRPAGGRGAGTRRPSTFQRPRSVAIYSAGLALRTFGQGMQRDGDPRRLLRGQTGVAGAADLEAVRRADERRERRV